MRNKGWTLGIIVIASLAFVAVALALVATPADASITGKPLPTYGDDWVIDQDTTVLGESIKLQGDIYVVPGNTFKVRNTEVKFNSSYMGEHGIYVDSNSTAGNGVVEIDDCTIRSDYEPFGWYFEVWGGLTITKARLYNVEDGIWMYNNPVSITNMTLYAQGRYGLNIMNADPVISSSEIHAMGYIGNIVTGIRVYGSSSDRSAPAFTDVTVTVYRNDDIYSTSSSTNVYFDMIGFDCYYGQFDVLDGLDIHFEANADILVNYTSTPRIYVYYYITGFYFGGGTILGGMDAKLSPSTLYVDADSEGAPNGYLYQRNYFDGLRNYIGSDGESPATFNGFSMIGAEMDRNSNGKYTEYSYYYNRGVRWFPSSGATTGDSYTFEGLHFENVEVEELFEVDMGRKHIFRDNSILNNYFDDYLFDYDYMNYETTWTGNRIVNNTMTGDQYFRLNRIYGEFNFANNEMSLNTYYRMFYIYYAYEKVIIEDNVFKFNKPHTSTYAFFYIYRNSAAVDLNDNTFEGNSWQYFVYLYYPYNPVEMLRNTLLNNTGSSWSMYMYYTQSGMSFDFEENSLINNTFNGFFYAYYQYALWNLEENYMYGNSFGANGFLWVYGYLYGGGYDITDNEFVNNTASASMFKFFGLGYWSTIQFTFERNSFINNSASTTTTGGLVYFYKVRQSLAVRDNYFFGNAASCIVFNTPYYYGYYYQGVENHWFYVEDNQFYNNSGKGIVFEQIDNNHILISDNEGSGNTDYVVYVYQKNDKQYSYGDSNHAYIYCYYNAQGPDTLVVENNNFSYNKGGGLYLHVSQIDTSPSLTYYPYGNPNQEVRVRKNMLMGNGPDGWSMYFNYLYSKPTVKSNRLDGSSMGIHWGLAPDNQARPFDLEIRDEVWDGGPDGMTAYGFTEVDADFYDCQFTNFRTCFQAEDCEVNVWWSGVPESSGETQGKGRIYIYNHLEIWVSWANATGVDSGIPVPGAIVAMQGANGKYFGALQTDQEGRLLDPEGEAMIVTPWTCVDGIMDSWSPFTITLLAMENVSYAHEVSLTSDYIAPHPLRLALWDIFIPEVIIANPQDDTLVNTADVLAEGFLFEIGSGITTFEGRSDMMPEDEWVTITRNVLWQHIFPGMTEGYHNLSVRSADLSGNWNTSTIEIIVDLTRPDLFVELEYLNATKIPYDPDKGGYFVRDKEIAINGTYGDNYALDGEVIIRINGVPKYIFPSQWGKIYERMELKQGINTIIVDATDTAGNREVSRLYVSLDSFPPTMYIYQPLDGQNTANETMVVTGLTEPITDLEIIVQASAGTNTYYTMSSNDGTFKYPVSLFEGIQKVLVTATDSAGNPTLIDLNVVLDTTPPDFIINQPPDAYVVTKLTRYTIVGTMTYEPDARIIIGGQEVPNTGVFQREVVLQEGENVIDIIAIDKVGNENTKYVTIVRDTVPPELEVTAPEGDYLITNNPVISFHGNVEGSTGVVILHKSIRLPAELVDGTWDSGEWKYDLELGPQDLEQDIEVIAFDLANNEDVSSIFVRLDIVPPSLSIDNVPEEVTTPFVWINGSTDTGIAFAYVQGVPYAVTNGVFEIQWSLAAGENNLKVEVMDEAGNVASNTVTTTYNPPKPPTINTGPNETIWDDILSIAGIAILLVAIVILVTAFFVVYSRRRR